MIDIYACPLPIEVTNMLSPEIETRRKMHEGLDGGSWYSLITKNLAIYSLSLKFWLIH